MNRITELAAPAAGHTATRERWLIGGAVALATAITGGVLIHAYSGGGYDEAGHRAAIEAASDVLSDWDGYLDVAKATCTMTPTELTSLVTVVGDTGPQSFALMQIDVRYLCPQRAGELDSLISADRIRRATAVTR